MNSNNIEVIKTNKGLYRMELTEEQYEIVKKAIYDHHNIAFCPRTMVIPKAFSNCPNSYGLPVGGNITRELSGKYRLNN